VRIIETNETEVIYNSFYSRLQETRILVSTLRGATRSSAVHASLKPKIYGFEVLTPVTRKFPDFWVVTPYSSKTARHFVGMCKIRLPLAIARFFYTWLNLRY
jgi:hypothetical protein